MEIFAILFLFSGLMIIYPYTLYPAMLRLLLLVTRRVDYRAPKKTTTAPPPRVSLLISAYNEESVIEEKILNTLSLDYPKEMLEVLVLSDGSTDRTDEIVKKYRDTGVTLLRYDGRQGKTACLNRAVLRASGDILVFSDANSLYDRDAVKNLAARFDDPAVGFATGFTRYRTGKEATFATGTGIYARLEKSTKLMESAFGQCVGADGAIFAVRRQLFKPLQASDINDFVIPLSIIRRRLKGVLEDKAFCTERAGGTKNEFNRQVRITVRTLRAVFNNRDLLNPLQYPFFSFALFSHKLAKLLVPFFLFLLFTSSLMLLVSAGKHAVLLSAACLFGGILMSARCGKKRFTLLSALCSFVYSFASINAAIFIGWFKFATGETFTVWAPTRR